MSELEFTARQAESDQPSWAIGTARTISWSSNLAAGTTVRVDLSRDGGTSWTALASASPASGSLAWTATSPATTTARVRVTANGGVPAVGTSGAFTIGNPTLSVTSPASGPGTSQHNDLHNPAVTEPVGRIVT